MICVRCSRLGRSLIQPEGASEKPSAETECQATAWNAVGAEQLGATPEQAAGEPEKVLAVRRADYCRNRAPESGSGQVPASAA